MKKAFQIKSENEKSNFIVEHDKKESTRLNKYISGSGFCSRREADRYIESGKVKIDGQKAKLGDIVFEHQEVSVDDHIITPKQDFVYIALHKPVGITCTTDTNIEGNICDFMNYKDIIFPVGRLDKESSGLILLTNDGDIVNEILRSTNGHEKEYIVSVNRSITNDFITKLSQGIKIYNPVSNTYQITKSAKVSKISDTTFNIVLTEGLNRQIRRMCTALGYHVQTLQRVRIMNIHLGDLRVGQWRYLNAEELRMCSASIQNSRLVQSRE